MKFYIIKNQKNEYLHINYFDKDQWSLFGTFIDSARLFETKEVAEKYLKQRKNEVIYFSDNSCKKKVRLKDLRCSVVPVEVIEEENGDLLGHYVIKSEEKGYLNCKIDYIIDEVVFVNIYDSNVVKSRYGAEKRAEEIQRRELVSKDDNIKILVRKVKEIEEI